MEVYIDAAEICLLLAAQGVAMITPRLLAANNFRQYVLRFVLPAGAQKVLQALETNTANCVSNCDAYTVFW